MEILLLPKVVIASKSKRKIYNFCAKATKHSSISHIYRAYFSVKEDINKEKCSNASSKH